MAERAVVGESSGREAPPLTLNNALEVVKTVKLSWRELAKQLGSEGQKKLDTIKRHHISKDARLKAVVEAFLLGKGYYQPSWRRLIHQLHKARETSVAEKIKTNAEPQQDPTMTVDNVTQILNKIPADKWEEVMGARGGGLDIPKPLLEEIQRRYSTDTEKNHACADYYVNCHPDAEWENLTWKLYYEKEFALARESKSFMSTDPTLTVDNVSRVMEKVEPIVKTQVWVDACARMEEDKMREMYMSGKENECADLYVNCSPYSSWEYLARSLYRHHQVAAVKEMRSYLPPRDPSLTMDNVSRIMEKVEPTVKAQVWVDACGAKERDKMKEVCTYGKEDECADLYVNCNPYSSWERLARSLYHHHQVAAVEEVRSYLPPRDLTITTEKLMELFAPLDPEEVDELGGEDCLGLPQSEIDRIQKDYQSPTQRKEAYLDLYVHQHPCPTWSQVAGVLYWRFNLHQQADLVENT